MEAKAIVARDSDGFASRFGILGLLRGLLWPLNWLFGRSLMFDDTFVHAAYNHSDEIGVVMFVDFVRPLHFPANLLNRLFILLVRHSRYLRVAKRKLESREAAHGPDGGVRAATP